MGPLITLHSLIKVNKFTVTDLPYSYVFMYLQCTYLLPFALATCKINLLHPHTIENYHT